MQNPAYHTHYETIAASQTDHVLGTTGARGDFIKGLVIVPATSTPGEVSLKDGAVTHHPILPGSIAGQPIKPIWVPLGAKSVYGSWTVTTGANVSVIAIGYFT